MGRPAGIISNLDLRPTKPRRSPARKFAPPVARQYAAAQYTNLTGDWNPLGGDVNDQVSSSAVLVRSRIRQLVRDNPHFSRAVKIQSAFTVGSGIAYQSKIVDEEGQQLKKLNQYIEDKFLRWMDMIDIAGRLHGYDMQDLASRQLSECGEFLLVRRLESRAEMPLKYQVIEPDALSGFSGSGAIQSGGKREISQGIEYDPVTYRVFRYHFLDDNLKQYSIPADQAIHGFHTLRPNQLRGISDFASGVLLADAFRNYIGSELSRKAMAARWLAVVKSPDPMRFQSGLENSEDAPYSRLEDVENATFQYLNPMEEIVFPTPPNDAGVSEFSELMLQMYSVSTGIPYEVLTQNYGSMSFSTAKIKRTDLKNELKPIIARFCRQFCEKIKRDFFRFGYLSGYLDLPGYEKNPGFYERGVWQSPGMEPTDLMREVKATIDEIKTGLRSPQEYIRSRGADPDIVLSEIASFKTLAESYGLDFEQALAGASTMMQQNPAKLDGENDEQGATEDDAE